MRNETSRKHYYLFAGVALSFLLRPVGSFVGKKLLTCCCDKIWGKGQNPVDEVFLPGETTQARVGAREVDMDNIFLGRISWDGAREALGWTPCKAKTFALLRLVFWHWMQPALYILTLFT